MNKYDYLVNTHDLETLSDWGPFARDIYALSHIADRQKGVKFDFCLIPGILRRSFFPPETLRECGCSPLEAAPDLSYFAFRQQMEGLDYFYCDTAYGNIGENLWLGRAEFVNNTPELRATSLLACIRLAPRPDVIPFIPEDARFIDALDYEEIIYSYKRFDHNLVNAGGRRGEQNFPGTVNNRCIGKPPYAEELPCFAEKAGDKLIYKFAFDKSEGAIYGRIRVDKGKDQQFKVLINGQMFCFDLNGTGEFELVELYRGELAVGNTMEIISAADGAGMRIDGFVLGNNELQISNIKFAPIGCAVSPQFQPGNAAQCCVVSSDKLDHAYSCWWSKAESSQRNYHVDNLANFVNYSYGLRQPYFVQYQNFGDEYCHDCYILPIEVASGGRAVIYTLYSMAENGDAAEKAIANIDKSNENLEKLFQTSRQRASIPNGTAAGKKYEFSQQLMRATSLTNINFPISKQGCNIRHHVPDKYYNSLYSWDSGFIGLGFLEVDKIRAIENLNVYVTDPDAENAFLLYGTPMPVQAYLYWEIWNRWQDRDMLEFFYPRLKQFYNFIAGHYPTSTYGKAKSNMLCSWDYFYNSGGWDDYPPQCYVHKFKTRNCIPVVTTAHAIRFAKILLQAAAELGIEQDKEYLQSDIAKFSAALQTHSWSVKDAVFSYVEHDCNGNPLGIWLDPASKENFNFGMDGTSPLVSGICSKDQREKLFARLADPNRMWSDIGISTVDKSAPYFRTDGYWNGCVWMPHQWFFWKAALDDNRPDFARKIALTALDLWQNEVDRSRYCFEHFSMSSHRGAGCCHFGGLSSPVLNWYASYYNLQQFTVGYDCWIKSKTISDNGAEAELVIGGTTDDKTTVLYVAGSGKWIAQYNNINVPTAMVIDGCLEITLPKNSSGKLTVKREQNIQV
jgi:hypothetical protein